MGTQDGFMCQGNGIITFGSSREAAYREWHRKQFKYLDFTQPLPLVSTYRQGLEPPVEP